MGKINIISILDDKNDALRKGRPVLMAQRDDEYPVPIAESLIDIMGLQAEIYELKLAPQTFQTRAQLELKKQNQRRDISQLGYKEMSIFHDAREKRTELNSITLLNGVGGRDAISKHYEHANQFVSLRGQHFSGGGKTYTFATNNALSATAHLLMTGDERGVLPDTKILFHISHQRDAEDERYPDEMTPVLQTPEQIMPDIQAMVDNILGSVKDPVKQQALRKEVRRQLQEERNLMPDLVNGYINRNTFDPQVIFSGAKAHEFGLVNNVYGTVGEMKMRLIQLLGREFGQQIVEAGPVAKFLESGLRFRDSRG